MKTNAAVVLATLICLSVGATAYSQQINQFTCEFAWADIDVAVQINGFDCGGGGTNGGFSGSTVSHLVRNGTNMVNICVSPEVTNMLSRFSFELKSKNVNASSSAVMAETSLISISNLSSTTTSMTFVVQGHSITNFPWVSLTSSALTSDDITAITNQVMIFRDALVRKDVAAVSQLLAPKTRHMSVAYGCSESASTVQQQAFFGGFFASAAYTVDLVDVAAIKAIKKPYRDYASVLIDDHSPIVIHGNDDRKLTIPMNFVKLTNGVWSVMF